MCTSQKILNFEKDGWMDRRMDMDGWMDGQLSACVCVVLSCTYTVK